MGKEALGDKQTCPNCSAKFYDLIRRPAVCPKCQTAFDPRDETARLRRTKSRPAAYDSQLEDEEEVPAETEDDGEAEAEEAAEIDQGPAEEPPVISDEEEDEAAAPEPEIPPGFTEDDGELDEEAGDEDQGVPLLEDEEEFSDETLGDIAESESDEQER